LKSGFSTPLASSHWPAGELSLMEPAGEMWSVVIESPNSAMMRACRTSRSSCAASLAGGCGSKSLKNGGSAM
jgi:hypothetical protein